MPIFWEVGFFIAVCLAWSTDPYDILIFRKRGKYK